MFPGMFWKSLNMNILRNVPENVLEITQYEHTQECSQIQHQDRNSSMSRTTQSAQSVLSEELIHES